MLISYWLYTIFVRQGLMEECGNGWTKKDIFRTRSSLIRTAEVLQSFCRSETVCVHVARCVGGLTRWKNRNFGDGDPTCMLVPLSLEVVMPPGLVCGSPQQRLPQARSVKSAFRSRASLRLLTLQFSYRPSDCTGHKFIISQS